MSTSKVNLLEARVALLERFVLRIYQENPNLKFPETDELRDMTFDAMADARDGKSKLFGIMPPNNRLARF